MNPATPLPGRATLPQNATKAKPPSHSARSLLAPSARLRSEIIPRVPHSLTRTDCRFIPPSRPSHSACVRPQRLNAPNHTGRGNEGPKIATIPGRGPARLTAQEPGSTVPREEKVRSKSLHPEPGADNRIMPDAAATLRPRDGIKLRVCPRRLERWTFKKREKPLFKAP